MVLQTIFEVCARERGYRGEGGDLEDTMVTLVGPRSDSQENLGGRYLTGGKERREKRNK